MSVRKTGTRVPKKSLAETIAQMGSDERQAYAKQVGAEVDRLLAQRGCALDVQPGFAPSQNGTYTIGAVARIVIKEPAQVK